jgi:hypothetical protein
MKKSRFLLPITFFLVGAIISGFLVAFLLTQATKKITEGDTFLYSGKFSQAAENYELAQKLWPFLYRDSQLNQKIQEVKDAEEQIKNAPALRIFFKSGISESEIQAFEQEVKNIAGVTEVKYVSKKDAFKIYAEQNKDDPELVKSVSPNIFPASLEIYLSDSSIKERVSQIAKTKSIVDEVIKSHSY